MNKIRSHESPSFWERQVREWNEDSSEPKSKYCKRKGLILHQFTYWQKKFEQEIEKSNNEKWLPIFDESLLEEKEPSHENPHCEIEFGNGTKLVFKNKSALSILETIIPLVKC